MEQKIDSDIEKKYVMEICIPFPSARHAEIAYNTLRVDKEPKKGGCKKVLELNQCKVTIRLEASEARILRVASNSILDFISLVTETMEQFGPPVPLD